MSHKNKIQGTEWETAVVAAAVSRGHEAERLAEGGSKDVGDVVVHHPDFSGLQELQRGLVALAFKQYETEDARSRRKATRVFVIDPDTFWYLVRLSGRPWFIECKARERLNVGEALAHARQKVAAAVARRLAGQGRLDETKGAD